VLIKKLFDGRLPKLVMLDLDGTLVDSVPSLASAVNDMLLELGCSEVDEVQVRGWVGNGALTLVKRALMNVGENERVDEGYNAFLRAYENRLSEQLILYRGVEEFLFKARSLNIRLAVVTNKPTRFTLPVLQSVNIDHYFDFLVCGDTYPRKKPDPMPLVKSFEQCAFLCSEVLMIGDSINDQAAAEAARVKFCGVPYGYNHGQVLDSEWLVESLDRLF
jgi:phosphoglycolate phosphatase